MESSSADDVKTKKIEAEKLPKDPYLGMVLDNTILEKKLGQGGMGAVYKGKHRVLNKYLAIKILPPEFARDEKYIERFLREARSAAQLEHPNIVQVFNAGEQDKIYFISMQFVSGQSLQNHISAMGKIPLEQSLWIMKGAMEGISFAHKSGIIHRDIKPDNIMLTQNGDVKVVDFGLARSAEAGSTLSLPGQVVGTPYFMSPEQCNGERVDHRSDIYSLGITFFYMLSGIRPYEGTTVMSIMMQHMNKNVPKTLEMTNASFPPQLCIIIKKMMEKEIRKRYQNLDEALKDLEVLIKQFKIKPLMSTVIQLPTKQPSAVASAETMDIESVSATQDVSTQNTHLETQNVVEKTNLPTIDLPPESVPSVHAPTQAHSSATPKPVSAKLTQTRLGQTLPAGALSESKVYQPMNRTIAPVSQKKKNPLLPIFFVLGVLGIVAFVPMLMNDDKKGLEEGIRNIEKNINDLKKNEKNEKYFEEVKIQYQTLLTTYGPLAQEWCKTQFKNLLSEEETFYRQKTPFDLLSLQKSYEFFLTNYPEEKEILHAQLKKMIQEELKTPERLSGVKEQLQATNFPTTFPDAWKLLEKNQSFK